MTNDGQNPTKAALRAGETIPVAEINRTASTFVVEASALAGFKCVWVDTEHSHIDLGDLSNLILAASRVPISSAMCSLVLSVSRLAVRIPKAFA